jgi:F-type H+-transporting ATPase subunit epsilon
MAATFQLDIISLTKPTFSGPVNSITVPGADGELTIMAHHIPLITPLKAGEIIIRHDDKETYMAVSSGFLVIDPGKVTVLADSADMLDELDEEKIMAAKAQAEKMLTEKQFADDRAFADTSAVLEKSIAQLKVLKRKKHHK